jgi:hypothetical protein
MVNHETFVRFCFKTGINLVLFGHEHIQYGLEKSPPPGTPDTPIGPPSVVRFLCCPSAFEYSQDNNGFFLIDFDRDGIEVTLYEWDSFGFNTQVGPDLLPL